MVSTTLKYFRCYGLSDGTAFNSSHTMKTVLLLKRSYTPTILWDSAINQTLSCATVTVFQSNFFKK